jgi:DNA mismatch repair protein MutS2
MLGETSEAKKLISIKGAMSFGGIKDIYPLLARVAKGASLNMAELLQIAAVLRTTKHAIDYFEDKKRPETEAKLLSRYIEKMYPNNFLEEKITTSILAEDIMADNATPELYDIRRKKRAAANRV